MADVGHVLPDGLLDFWRERLRRVDQCRPHGWNELAPQASARLDRARPSDLGPHDPGSDQRPREQRRRLGPETHSTVAPSSSRGDPVTTASTTAPAGNSSPIPAHRLRRYRVRVDVEQPGRAHPSYLLGHVHSGVRRACGQDDFRRGGKLPQLADLGQARAPRPARGVRRPARARPQHHVRVGQSDGQRGPHAAGVNDADRHSLPYLAETGAGDAPRGISYRGGAHVDGQLCPRQRRRAVVGGEAFGCVAGRTFGDMARDDGTWAREADSGDLPRPETPPRWLPLPRPGPREALGPDRPEHVGDVPPIDGVHRTVALVLPDEFALAP